MSSWAATPGEREMPDKRIPNGSLLAQKRIVSAVEGAAMKEPYYKTHEPPHCPTCDCADTGNGVSSAQLDAFMMKAQLLPMDMVPCRKPRGPLHKNGERRHRASD